jgi:hypothetical protein
MYQNICSNCIIPEHTFYGRLWKQIVKNCESATIESGIVWSFPEILAPDVSIHAKDPADRKEHVCLDDGVSLSIGLAPT